MAREIVFVLLFNLLTRHIWKEIKITMSRSIMNFMFTILVFIIDKK